MATTVYIETSVVNYLTSWTSRDLIIAARQAMTQDWWDLARRHYELRVSILVLDEASRGDAEAATRRLDAISDLPVLTLNEEAEQLAGVLLDGGHIPKNSAEDAFHIAIAASHGVDYLVTWNFRHINNAETRLRIQGAVETFGYGCPIICSPEELGGIA